MVGRLLLPVLVGCLWTFARAARIALPDDFPEFPAFPDLSDIFRPPEDTKSSGSRYAEYDEDNSSEDLSVLGDQEDEPRKPGRQRYQQIFKFNKDRVNLAEFDRRKKKLGLEIVRHDGLDPDLIPRRKFLVLRGGTFKSLNY